MKLVTHHPTVSTWNLLLRTITDVSPGLRAKELLPTIKFVDVGIEYFSVAEGGTQVTTGFM